MAVDVQTELKPNSISDLSSVLQRLQDETGRSAEDSVSYAGLKIAESLRSASKLGKKNRDIVPNPAWKENSKRRNWAKRQQREGHAIPADAQAEIDALKSISPLFIVARRQGKGPAMLPAWERKDPRRVIEQRGLAKKIASVMVGKMGAMKSGAGNAGGVDYRVSKYKESLGDGAGSDVVRLINKLPYLKKAFPGIQPLAIQKGTKALVGMLDRRIAAAAARANGGK